MGRSKGMVRTKNGPFSLELEGILADLTAIFKDAAFSIIEQLSTLANRDTFKIASRTTE
jgi:hypothetical protein